MTLSVIEWVNLHQVFDHGTLLAIMFPTLLSIGNFSISSYGFFLALAFLYGLFLVWRLIRAWELNEEKVLDLTLITFLGGLAGARLFYFILSGDILKILLIHKYPGFSFWGGLLTGFLTLTIFSKRLKIDLWQALDCASVGLLGGLILSDIGCFLAGCNVGLTSNLFFALPVAGLLGKRIPISAIEALLFLIAIRKIWTKATHFHPRGKILSISLISIGSIKLITEPFKQVKDSYIFSTILIVLGLVIFYKVTKKNFLEDFKNILLFPIRFASDSDYRYSILVSIKKSWYNQKLSLIFIFKNLSTKIRRLNVRFSHKNSKYY